MTNNKPGYLKTHFASIIVAACAIVLARAAWATTWYVDAAKGNSSNDGKSWETPLKSIQSAIDKTSKGDAVLVNDGTYSPISTASKRITISSVNGPEKTKIDGGGSKRCATLAKDLYPYDDRTNTVVQGFTLQNGYASSNGGGAYCGTLKSCVIKNNSSTEYGGGVGFVYMENCTVVGNINKGGQRGGGAWESYCVNCMFQGNQARCGAAASQSTLFGCIVVGNTALEGGATHCGKSYNCVIVGNYAPKAAGVYAENPVNCIIWNNYKTGTKEVCNYESAGLKYCCSSPLYSGDGNICADPKFYDEANGDYHLRSDSPCVDSGLTIQRLSFLVDLSKDYDGQNRISGWRMDMGPYERFLQEGRNPTVPITWYVDQENGDDANAGNRRDQPLADINAAVIVACDGDRVVVADGVYRPLRTWNKNIVIKSENGPDRTIIDGSSSYSTCIIAHNGGVPVNDTMFIGFTIRGGRYGGVDAGTYENCIIRENDMLSSTSAAGAEYADLRNCLICNNKARESGAAAVRACWVRNCTIVDNDIPNGYGVAQAYTLDNSIVYGNTANGGVDVSSTWTDAAKRQFHNCCGNAAVGIANIVANPCFIDSAHGNYRLRNDSPCINAGTNQWVRNKYDLDGNYRIKGKVVDLGAYENQTAYPGAEVGYASARQRYPWNGLVDVAFDVFGLPDNATTNVVMSADGDLLKGFAMSTFPEQGLSGLSNGTWKCVWDAGTDAPRVLDSNLVVTVALPNNGDRCVTTPTRLDTRSQPRDAAAAEELLIDADWQTEVSAEDVTATLTQTPPGFKTTKLAEYSGSGGRSYNWNAAAETVPGVHLFTLTLKENSTGKVLKTMTSSFTVAGAGGEVPPLFTDDPVQIPLSFSSWDGIGTFLNDSRAALMRVDGVTVVPPSTNIVVISLGEFAVPALMLMNLPDTVESVEEYGVSVYRLHVREIGDGTSGLVAKIGDVPVSELSIPAYNPDRWVEALYGTPPTWLTGEARTRWYVERDISRIEWYMTLVSQADIADYRANRAAALSEASEERPSLALSGLVANASSDALHSLTVNAKEDSVVDVFGKRTLTETNWTYAGRAFIPAGKSAVGVVSDDLSYFMTVVRVADVAEGGGAVVTQGDSDHDGIPDSVETMTYGSNPHSADTSGGGIGDWEKVYVYGLNPRVTDTDGDGYDDIEELMSGTDPKTPAPGADTSIRYFYDDDDQLTRIHFGSHGAMSSVVLSPEGNPKNVKEKAK